MSDSGLLAALRELPVAAPRGPWVAIGRESKSVKQIYRSFLYGRDQLVVEDRACLFLRVSPVRLTPVSTCVADCNGSARTQTRLRVNVHLDGKGQVFQPSGRLS